MLLFLKKFGSPHTGYVGTTQSGIWCEVVDDDGKKRFYEPHRIDKAMEGQQGCSQFIDGHCMIQDIKYQVSKDWPYHPSQTDMPFSQCTYRFVSIGQRKIGDNVNQGEAT